MLYIIKLRTIALGKNIKDLHEEVQKRGVEVDYGDFCNYIKGKKPGDAAERSKRMAELILDEWERPQVKMEA